jgi:hypothetical protein
MIFTFVKEPDGTVFEDNQSNVGMEFKAVELDEIVAHFEDFLKGCGFIIDGHLDFVEDENDCK